MSKFEFSNFDELLNSTHISTNNMYVCGQGLVDTYEYIHLGTGYNKYTLVLEYGNKQYNFYTEDDFIKVWKSMTHDEGSIDMEKSFDFEAFGNFDGKFNKNIYSCDCDDNTLFIIDDINFKLINIVLDVNNSVKVKPISGINNEIIYCDKIMKKINEKINIKKNSKNIHNNDRLSIITLKQIKLSKRFVFKDTDKQRYDIIFNDITVKKDSNGIYKIKCNINITTNELINQNTIATITWYEGDEETTHFKLTIPDEVFGDVKIDEYCDIYEVK